MAERRQRKKKSNRLLPNDLSAIHLFFAGMGTLPAFLFQERLDIRILQVMLFAFLVSRAGKRIQWLYFLLMLGSITVFHLLSPWGEVLFRIGPLRITLGALEQGLTKGFTIVGLVFVSLFTIRSDLRLPGRLGGLIGKVFYYYERILEGRGGVDPTRLIASLDGILSSSICPERFLRTAGPRPEMAPADPGGVPFRSGRRA